MEHPSRPPAPRPVPERVAAVRAFNRFYTGVIGVLQDGLLHTPYTLTEARVLFELARRDGMEAGELRRALALDAGYLSRILNRFTNDGLVVRSRSVDDGRRRSITLTDLGRTDAATLDERSTAQVNELLGGLGEPDQQRLIGAMQTIERLLSPTAGPGARMVVLRSPLPGELGWIVQRHGELYAAEHGFDGSFEAWVARIVAGYASAHDPEREAVWIAEVDGSPAGCVMCVRDDDDTARLRVLLVEPGARGLGVGGRLVDECLRFARRAGYHRIVLSTYDAMAAARRIYHRAGFSLDSEQKVTAHGQELTDETWSRPL